MNTAGFEPAIPVVYRLQTYTLDRRASGIGKISQLSWFQWRLLAGKMC